MDLLKGYGSDDSSASSSSDSTSNDANAKAASPSSAPAASTAQPPASVPGKMPPKLGKAKRGGKRILSLGAVLPPEIFDRLTRPPEEDDSSASSFEGGGEGGPNKGTHSKKRKRRPGEEGGQPVLSSGAGDRTELNSLLSELRSTPLHVAAKKTLSKKSGDVPRKDESGKLGMAFMSYTTTTKTSKKKMEVVDVHAAPSKSVAKATAQTSKNGGEKTMPKPTPPPARAMPSFTRMSAAAPVAPSFRRSAPEYPAASMPDYPMENADPPTKSGTSNMAEAPSFNNSGAVPKSRKQKRDEERALRSGQAFNDTSATEIHQPSPTEFAPTAHAAAIASRAARARGVAAGGGGSVKNIAMYDPSSGADVKGLGVTGKHRSKHQINQLMANAISLEAHRASEAELARFGMGGGGTGKGGSRADAKKKYGW